MELAAVLLMLAQHDQGVEQVERRCGDDEHVNRYNVWKVFAQKAPPSRGGDPPPDRGLPDLDVQLEELSMNAWGAPQRVGVAHAADQITDFWVDPGSSRTT